MVPLLLFTCDTAPLRPVGHMTTRQERWAALWTWALASESTGFPCPPLLSWASLSQWLQLWVSLAILYVCQCVDAPMCLSVSVLMWVCVCVCACVCESILVFLYVWAYEFGRMCEWMYVCECVFVCAHLCNRQRLRPEETWMSCSLLLPKVSRDQAQDISVGSTWFTHYAILPTCEISEWC